MMDNGFPFTTEPNALMEIIPPPNMLKSVVKGITGQSSINVNMPEGGLTNTPWRKTGVRYAANEIYFDVIEDIECVVEP
jgi:AP-3 complex subunit mu